MGNLTVVALGPDAAEMLTLQAAEALLAAGEGRILLRTGQHGVAGWLAAQEIAFDTLDSLYDRAEDFDALGKLAADAVEAALSSGDLCYGVADPASDATVAVLAARGVKMHVLAGVTQADLARTQALCAGFSTQGGLRTLAAADFLAGATLDPSQPLIVTELNSALQAGEVKLRLLALYPPEHRILLDRTEVSLEEMDRRGKYSHRSAVYIPSSPMTARQRYTFEDLLAIMAQLRHPTDGCPWDREQTNETLRPYIIEEAYELVDAINSGDMGRVADELGDVLLQVVFHAQVAKEHGEFDITEVTTAICHKMITRHAHIFGDIVCETSEDVLKSWEAIKKKEKGLRGATDSMRDLPGSLPALMRAQKVQSKARQVGFDWDDPAGALDKVSEEADEVRAALHGDPGALEMEYGDLLFAAVNAARLSGVQPEVALGLSTDKFIRRFARMEQAILADHKRMQDMTLADMDVYWDAVKRAEKEER